MTVAAVAYDKLDTNIRSRVAALLKLNPNYKQWIAGVPANERDKVAFINAATWPDLIKGATGYTNDNLQKSGAKAAQNIGYPDKLQHRYWHFIDMPFSPDGTKLVDPVPPNAKTQIAEFRKTIAPSSKVPDKIKSYDLVWLLHLVGDVHQPLHATSRFDNTQTNGDTRSAHLISSPGSDRSFLVGLNGRYLESRTAGIGTREWQVRTQSRPSMRAP